MTMWSQTQTDKTDDVQLNWAQPVLGTEVLNNANTNTLLVANEVI